MVQVGVTEAERAFAIPIIDENVNNLVGEEDKEDGEFINLPANPFASSQGSGYIVKGKNTKVRTNFSENYACVRTLGLEINIMRQHCRG